MNPKQITSNSQSRSVRVLVTLLYVLLAGCAVQPYDYSALIAAKPRSIVVIPPLNNSVEVNAPYQLLSTLTAPLAEKGYYVFPVAVMDTLFKENGLPTTAEMNMVPLDRLREVTGADAALYCTIADWGQKYQVLSSVSVVQYSLRLMDTRSGNLLWDAQVYQENSSSNSNSGLLEALVGALVEQMMSAVVDNTPDMARVGNFGAVNSAERGLLPGPYRPEAHAAAFSTQR
jgi:hypothetical protein